MHVRTNLIGALAAALALLLSATAALASPSGGSRTLDVIVVLDDAFAPGGHAANQARAAQVARQHGLEARFAYGTALFGFAASLPEGRLAGLARDPRVEYVEMDTAMHAFAPKWCDTNPDHPACGDGGGEDDSTDPAPSTQTLPWGVDRVDADLNANTGDGVHVYIVDTGIDSDHPDLVDNLGNGYAIETCKGGKTCLQSWDDDHGHGTHVAGTVGAIDNDLDVVGVAPEVTLHAVKVLSKAGSGTRSGVIAGIDWVTREVTARSFAPAVINMSLGGSGSKTGTCASSGFSGADSYHQSICRAANAGVVFAVAAGNSGVDAENSVPAAYEDAVITVSATNRLDAWASWSNYGDGTSTAVAPAPVAIAAPGVDVESTAAGGGVTTMSGTSMAAPHVAGAVALYLDSNPTVSGYEAFTAARASLLSQETGFPADKDGKHTEPFLDVESL